LTPKNGFKNTD